MNLWSKRFSLNNHSKRIKQKNTAQEKCRRIEEKKLPLLTKPIVFAYCTHFFY